MTLGWLQAKSLAYNQPFWAKNSPGNNSDYDFILP